MSTALPGSPTDRLCQVIMNGQREAFETAVFDMHQALLPPGFLALAVTHERHEFMPTLLDRSGSQARMAALGLALEFHPDMVAVILRHRATDGINNFFDLHDALAWAAGEGQSRAVGALLEMGVAPHPQQRGDLNPLAMAAANGHAALVQTLWPLVTETPPREEALMAAAGHGQGALVETLWDRVPTGQTMAVRRAFGDGHEGLGAQLWMRLKPEQQRGELATLALIQAARQGDAALARQALPLAHPDDQQALALRQAVEFGHDALIDLLVPVSSPMLARQAWTRQVPRRWDLVNRLLLHLPAVDQKAWMKQAPKHFNEAQAVLRARRSTSERPELPDGGPRRRRRP